MDPTNIALWVIVIAMVVIVPIGCILTRPKDDAPPPAGH